MASLEIKTSYNTKCNMNINTVLDAAEIIFLIFEVQNLDNIF